MCTGLCMMIKMLMKGIRKDIFNSNWIDIVFMDWKTQHCKGINFQNSIKIPSNIYRYIQAYSKIYIGIKKVLE